MNAKMEKKLIIYTDGGARGNPGSAAIGVVVGDKMYGERIEDTTNNVAEYSAVIEALCFLRDHNLSSKEVLFVLDSELIVRQITGVYKVKQSHLLELKNQVLKVKLLMTMTMMQMMMMKIMMIMMIDVVLIL